MFNCSEFLREFCAMDFEFAGAYRRGARLFFSFEFEGFGILHSNPLSGKSLRFAFAKGILLGSAKPSHFAPDAL